MQTKALVAAALLSIVTHTFTQSIDPDSVPLYLRDSWCLSQKASCPLICTQETGGELGTYANDCDPDTLVYNCVCANGLSPNISEYSQTVPYYICTQSNTDCQTNCGSNNDCAAACLKDHPCGAQNPTRVNATGSATMSATGTGASGSGAASTAVYNGFGSSATASPGSGDGQKGAAGRLIVNMGQIYGLGVVATGVFAGFTFLL